MIFDKFMTRETLVLVIALIVILAVFLLRGLLAKLLIRILFQRTRRRNLDKYKLIKAALNKPASFTILTGVIRGAVNFMGLSDPYFEFAADIGSTLFMAATIWLLYAAAGLAAASWLSSSVSPAEKGINVNPTAARFVTSAVQITIIVLGLLLILSRWVSDISGLIAGLGIGGLAVALAAQDTAANLFGSIAIMLDKPFEIGDWVEVEGHMGVVEKVGLRSSRIRALDQSVISMPNARLANSNIVNGTRRGRRRVAFKLSVVLSTPPDKISLLVERIKKILEADEEIEKESMLVCLDGFAGSAMEIFVNYYTLSDYMLMMLAKERINYAILQATAEIEVAIALPSISLYREK